MNWYIEYISTFDYIEISLEYLLSLKVDFFISLKFKEICIMNKISIMNYLYLLAFGCGAFLWIP